MSKMGWTIDKDRIAALRDTKTLSGDRAERRFALDGLVAERDPGLEFHSRPAGSNRHIRAVPQGDLPLQINGVRGAIVSAGLCLDREFRAVLQRKPGVGLGQQQDALVVRTAANAFGGKREWSASSSTPE